jgi:hypothetical protein
VSDVGLLQHFAIEHELRGAVCHHPASERNHVMEPLSGAGKVVRGCYHRPTACRLGIQDVHDLLLRDGVHSRDRLVQQINLRVRSECARNENPSPLSSGEFADLTRRKVCHVYALQRLRNCGTICGASTAERSNPWRTPHCHHLIHGDRKTPIHLFCLRDIRNARCVDSDRCAEHLNSSRPRTHESSDALQQRGLPTTVRAEDGGERALCKLKGDVADGGAFTVACSDVGDSDRTPPRMRGGRAAFEN